MDSDPLWHLYVHTHRRISSGRLSEDTLLCTFCPCTRPLSSRWCCATRSAILSTCPATPFDLAREACTPLAADAPLCAHLSLAALRSNFAQSSWCVASLAYMPDFYLKQMLLKSFPRSSAYPQVVDFVVEQLDELQQEDIASRLTLNCTPGKVRTLPANVNQSRSTHGSRFHSSALPAVPMSLSHHSHCCHISRFRSHPSGDRR